MKYTHIINSLALLSILSLPACSDDTPTDLMPEIPGSEEVLKKEVTVSVNLSTHPLNGVLTRADLKDPENNDIDIYGTDNERINDWFMILVHADDRYNKLGKIAKIVKRSDSNVLGPEGDANAAVLREKFNLSLDPGKYHVYTFGNINYDDFKMALAKHLDPSATAAHSLDLDTEMPNIDNFAWKEFHNQVISESANIPLSSVDSDLEVDGLQASMEIELERVVGKLQFYFANHTSSQWIRIKRFELMPIRNESYLLEHVKEGGLLATPSHTHNNAAETIVRNNPTSEDSSPDITGNTWSGWFVPEETKTNGLFAKCPDLGFYVNESVPEKSTDYPLGHFKLKLLIERVINDNGTDVVAGEEVRSSMLHNLTAIERNQWYMQPIMFTDWVLQPEIHYYPPIGGYPVVQVEESSSFEECYSTFKDVTSASPFQIRLRLHDLSDPDVWYDVTDTRKVNGKVTVGGVEREQSYWIRVSDPDGIFNHTTLSLDNSGLITSPDGQLTGHFTGNAGRAIISVYANIAITSDVHYTYERDLYVITQKTSNP